MKVSPLATKRRQRAKSESAATLLKTNYVTLELSLSVGAALQKVRAQAKRGDIFYLYVTDQRGCLHGIVSIRNLLLTPDHEGIEKVISRNVVTLPENVTIAEAQERFAECRFLTLPVVSAEGVIQGVLHAQDLTRAFQTQSDSLFEDRHKGALFELLGLEAESKSTSVLGSAQARFPWLLVNMMGGAISAFLIHTLAPKIPEAVLFLAFVPVLLIVSESIGMQTVSMIITKLRHAQNKSRDVTQRELKIAATLGLAAAVMIGAVAYTFGSPIVSLVVAISMLIGSVWVAVVAYLVPTFIRKWGIDPSVSSGPVVLAIADCTVLALFLLIAFLSIKF